MNVKVNICTGIPTPLAPAKCASPMARDAAGKCCDVPLNLVGGGLGFYNDPKKHIKNSNMN
eukprot:4088971-Amphidinium_carterae.1